MNGELAATRKEAAVAYFKALLEYLPGGPEKPSVGHDCLSVPGM